MNYICYRGKSPITSNAHHPSNRRKPARNYTVRPNHFGWGARLPNLRTATAGKPHKYGIGKNAECST